VQPVLQNLLALQSVDIDLHDLRARLGVYPSRKAAIEAQVNAARAGVENSKSAHLTALKERKKYELDVQVWKEKAQKYKDQSYQVKTNEAFKALQHEVQMAEAEAAKAEDRLLEEMVASEEYDRKIKGSEKLLKEVEATAKSEQEKLSTEHGTLEARRKELEKKRAEAVAAIPEDMLDHYNRIARKHGGTALAEIREEKCGACGMRVRPHVFQEIRRDGNKEIFHCETCTRMLYYEEPSAGLQDVVAEQS
jgi:predicted  nucleic acid-binding Zn-ribbon protein